MNHRNSKRSKSIDPLGNLVADIIIDAIQIASGQSPGSDKDRAEAAYWLQSATCERWAGVIGVDIGATLEHRDSLVEIEM